MGNDGKSTLSENAALPKRGVEDYTDVKHNKHDEHTK